MEKGSARPLVFDLDGTLIDSRQDIAAACNFALSRVGLQPKSVAEICSFVGNGAPYLLCGTAGIDEGDPLYGELQQHFQDYYLRHPFDLCSVLPGAMAALGFPGRLRAMCTNKPRAVTQLISDGLGFAPLLSSTVAAGDCPQKKPHPEPLQLVAQQLAVPATALIMIGDGPQDILAGHAVGAHTIGVRGGLLPEEQMVAAEPHVVLDSLLELPDYLAEAHL